MKKLKDKKFRGRKKRKLRVRSKLRGTADRPRMSVHRSLKNISVQFIDDQSGRTLGAVSTLSPRFREKFKGNGGTLEAARQLGKEAAELAGKLEIKKVVYDRGGYKYHGRVKALADAARENGLTF